MASVAPSQRSRRVPADLRKRTAQSCDFCKTRRRRCVRAVPGHPCLFCKENSINCNTTIARKQRGPTSAMGTLPNYVVIEKLIARLFPKVLVRDSNQLANLATYLEDHNVEIQFDDNRLAVSANPMKILSFDLSTDQSSQEGIPLMTADSTPAPAKIADNWERILQNSSGTLSYFGPSSSMAFVTQLREELVSNEKQNLDLLQPKQRHLRRDFAADNHCCTMEKVTPTNKQCSGHPSLVRLDDENDTSAQASIADPIEPQSFADLLPIRREVDELVERFFVHVHPNMLLFHPPLFQNALEDLWLCDKPGSEDVGWMVCCFMVITLGCEHEISTSVERSTSRVQELINLQRKLLDLALGRVAQLILSATLQSVQSFALLSLYLNATNQRNASWIMMGNAIRMAISLGMHRGDKLVLRKHLRLTPIGRELRKRVWWTLYIFEQYSCALFGRPSGIDDLDITSDLPIESVLDEGRHRPPGLMTQDISLARIVGKIRKSQADQQTSSSLKGYGTPDSRTAHRLLAELDMWYGDLPPQLKLDESNQDRIYPCHFRQLLTLQLRYQHARLLLTRPFHLKILQIPPPTVLDGTPTEVFYSFGDVGVGAALQSCKLTYNLWEKGEFEGNLWLDGVFAYQCGMVLSLACLDAMQRPSTINRRDLERAVETTLQILRDVPSNRPMSRMVQIANDFSSIVRAMTPGPLQSTAHDQQPSLQTSQNHSTNDALSFHRETPFIPQRTDLVLEESTEVHPSWNPPLTTSGFESITDTNHQGQASYALEFQDIDVIDFMVDWDFPQAFGFDSGNLYHNL
jgi:proline utilization trans-activator